MCTFRLQLLIQYISKRIQFMRVDWSHLYLLLWLLLDTSDGRCCVYVRFMLASMVCRTLQTGYFIIFDTLITIIGWKCNSR